MKTLMSALLLALLATAPAAAAGAFAVDTEEGQKAGDEGYGIGWGDSREAAGAAAMKPVRKMGNDNCKVVARFDACGAYVSNRTTLRRRLGPDRGRRQGDGLRQVPELQARPLRVRVTVSTLRRRSRRDRRLAEVIDRRVGADRAHRTALRRHRRLRASRASARRCPRRARLRQTCALPLHRTPR